ncbi:MAG TPA: SAF domain-containing protein [Acidimicrobiia bacterium]|jgi:Flp pilus assembly protein CpaB
MVRSPRALALRIAAVVVAALTARVVATDIQSIHNQAHSLGPVRNVVVAKRTLLKGEIVERADIGVVARHAGQEPRDVLADPASAVGRAITIDVARGAPLLRANVSKGGTGTSGALRVDERVVRVVDASGLTPDAGAIVDVYATLGATSDTNNNANPNDGATLVARGARVLRVDHSPTDVPSAHATSSTSTTGMLLLVNASETADIASAVADGVMTVAIAPVEDACCVDPS